ncbi:unnamed protein product [Dovyalis caffra]|uniref:Uncharacterized protein n=1 Tax=Dovyalis caffra TaxID=77055 RepID=A0AAV1SMK2_9ROSI|nr:unnamed protein product [Dovyalis caffra]
MPTQEPLHHNVMRRARIEIIDVLLKREDENIMEKTWRRQGKDIRSIKRASYTYIINGQISITPHTFCQRSNN